MSPPPPLRPGDRVRLPSPGGGGGAAIVLARRGGGWDLLDGDGTRRACTDAEVAAARAAGALLHLPAGPADASDPAAQRRWEAARIEAGRRLLFVRRVDELCAGPTPSVAACRRAAGEVHAENAARWEAQDGREIAPPGASTVRTWHLRWTRDGRDIEALIPQTHLRGNREPRHAGAGDGMPDAYEFIEDARPADRRHGAVARAFRSYARDCGEVGISPVGEATFRRRIRTIAAPAPTAEPIGPVGRADAPPLPSVAEPDPVVRHAALLTTWAALDAHAIGGVGAGPRLLAVTGQGGTGARTAARRWADERGEAAGGTVVLRLDAPGPTAKGSLAIAMLRAMGLKPGPATSPERAIEDLARRVDAAGTRLVVIAQGHRLAPDERGTGAAEHLAALVDRVDARFVVSGDPRTVALAAALGPDRARVHRLPTYDLADAAPGGAFSELARGLAALAGLAWPPPGDPAWNERLCAATGGLVAEAGRYLRSAAALAAERGLATADAMLMSEVDRRTAPARADPPGGPAVDDDPFRCPVGSLAALRDRRAAEAAA